MPHLASCPMSLVPALLMLSLSAVAVAQPAVVESAPDSLTLNPAVRHGVRHGWGDLRALHFDSSDVEVRFTFPGRAIETSGLSLTRRAGMWAIRSSGSTLACGPPGREVTLLHPDRLMECADANGGGVRLVSRDSLYAARAPSQQAMAEAWEKAVGLGLMTLPPAPDRRTKDGGIWVSSAPRWIVEVREGQRYRATTDGGLKDLDVGRRMGEVLGAINDALRHAADGPR